LQGRKDHKDIHNSKREERVMTPEKPEKKPLFRLPISADVNVDVANIKTQEKKILEFVQNAVKPQEAIVVKADKWGGLVKQSFVVLNVDGKDILIKHIKEDKVLKKKNRKKGKYPRATTYV
jgi:hypothetical protein